MKKEEILEWFIGYINTRAIPLDHMRKFRQIVALIGASKEVTEEFVKRWNKTLLRGYKLENIHGEKDYCFALEQMLREAGVEVVGK